jgi:hypothetical protein
VIAAGPAVRCAHTNAQNRLRTGALMDDRHFDTLTSRLVTGWRHSRRAAVAALLAAVLPRAAAAQCANPCGVTPGVAP